MLRGETKQGPLLAMARSPLHPLTAPHLDTYVAVALPYSHRTDDGLPDEGSLEPLRAFEDRLESAARHRGQVVAHLSNAGVRTLHLYVDSTADVLPTVKDLAARPGTRARSSVHDMHDPGWSAVSHLRAEQLGLESTPSPEPRRVRSPDLPRSGVASRRATHNRAAPGRGVAGGGSLLWTSPGGQGLAARADFCALSHRRTGYPRCPESRRLERGSTHARMRPGAGIRLG